MKHVNCTVIHTGSGVSRGLEWCQVFARRQSCSRHIRLLTKLAWGHRAHARSVNSGLVPGRHNNTDNDNSVIKTEGAWLHTSLVLMSIAQPPRRVWFCIQINVSTPDCFIPFYIEGSRRQGEFRLTIANEASINVKWQVIVRVIFLFITGFYVPSLSLIFSDKMTEERFHSTTCLVPTFFLLMFPHPGLEHFLFSKQPTSPLISALTV